MSFTLLIGSKTKESGGTPKEKPVSSLADVSYLWDSAWGQMTFSPTASNKPEASKADRDIDTFSIGPMTMKDAPWITVPTKKTTSSPRPPKHGLKDVS